ncbi:NAD(P)-dependent dehydrogenase (short-subunit alcohol dehydrogenase family) [Sphingomonas sp. F9_3S_D5_B_2]
MPNVLITGANRGIGLEFARQYAADGWDVIATARQSSPELDGLGVRVEQLDMQDLDAVVGLGERMSDLDLLIANAGTWIPEQAQTAEEGRAWTQMLVTNTIAPFLLTKSVLGTVGRAGGKLIALTSGMGSIGESSGGYVPYRTSKAALNMAWHSLAIEAKRSGVVAAVLDPGWVKTRMGGPNAPLPPEQSVAEMRGADRALGTGRQRRLLQA